MVLWEDYFVIFVIKRLSHHAYTQTGHMKPSQATLILEFPDFSLYLSNFNHIPVLWEYVSVIHI